MTPVPGERKEAMVRAAIRRFNEASTRPDDGDRPWDRGRLVLGGVTMVDGHVLARGEWWRARPGAEERVLPLVLSWAFGEGGDVTSIQTFPTTAEAIAAAIGVARRG
jgi:hypothetical protein